MVIIKEWFTVTEAAEYLSVSKRTIYKLTQEGRLPAFSIGNERHRRFLKIDLDKTLLPVGNSSLIENAVKLTAQNDPLLAELWDNEQDAAYDQL
jgi:excisionase family DNA binding protein